MSLYKTSVVILFTCLALVACVSPHPIDREPLGPKADWTFQDLVTLNPPDDIDPSADIIALYFRTVDQRLDIRLDLLMFADQPPYDMKVCLVVASISQPEYIIYKNNETQGIGVSPLCVTYSGDTHEVSQDDSVHAQGYVVSQYIDSVSDFIVFSIVSPSRGSAIQFDQIVAYGYHPETGELIDQLGPLSLHTRVPEESKANLLLEYWNVLNEPTPASILRAWDGAHSGPFGGRHGLSHLLQASTQYEVPVYILDLKTPNSLNAIKMVNGIDRMIDYERTGLVILPRSTWGDPILSRQSLEIGGIATFNAGLRVNPLIFSPILDPVQGATAQFAVLEDPNHLAVMKGTKLIPFLGPIDPVGDHNALAFFSSQVDLKGLTLDSRRSILRSATNEDPNDLVLLGGSLSHSSWGDAAGAAEAFKYLHDHPWIKFPSVADLETMPSHPGNLLSDSCLNLLCAPELPDTVEVYPYTQATPMFLDSSKWREDLRSRISTLSNDVWRELVLSAYLQLTKPERSLAESSLAVGDLSLVERLIHVDAWIKDPVQQTVCNDFFWGTDCVLSTETYYASLDPSSGMLVLGVVSTEHSPELFIAPSGLFVTGLSSPEGWSFRDGPFADPASLPGVHLRTDSQRLYQPEVNSNAITFSSADGITKRYSLSGNTLQLSVNLLDSDLRIPVLWRPAQMVSDSAIVFKSPAASSDIRSTPSLSIFFPQGSAKMSIVSYLDSKEFLSLPEDPNMSYPPGHYLPLPFSVITVAADGSLDLFFEYK